MSDAPSRPAPPGTGEHWLTRELFLRLLGGIYFFAYLSLARQVLPLLGDRGLLPVRAFVERFAEGGSRWDAFVALPSLFFAAHGDLLLQTLAWVGAALSLAVVAGLGNAPILGVLWLLYLSYVHVGQIFWGFGWETLLLETGFLAIFFAPPLRPTALGGRDRPPAVPIWCLRWLLFRVMFGAGLIKMRGDDCWRDLSCLLWHYETQPLPNPLSWLLHQAPPWFHTAEVLWNHFVELVVPFFLFWPRRGRIVAGALVVAFQLTLVLSGNLSWLNWLTIAVAVSCFDDRALGWLAGHWARARAEERWQASPPPSRARKGIAIALAVLVGVLSLDPVANLLSPDQRMNASFDRLELVNTYGAFGSVGSTRWELVIEGTSDEVPTEEAHWKEYELPCKPGDPVRRPCVVAPYHFRADWMIWFPAMAPEVSPALLDRHAWLVNLLYKLLAADPAVKPLLARDPFHLRPPRWVRILRYEYRFTRLGDGSGAWWTRTRLAGEWFPPLEATDPELRAWLAERGLL